MSFLQRMIHFMAFAARCPQAQEKGAGGPLEKRLGCPVFLSQPLTRKAAHLVSPGAHPHALDGLAGGVGGGTARACRGRVADEHAEGGGGGPVHLQDALALGGGGGAGGHCKGVRCEWSVKCVRFVKPNSVKAAHKTLHAHRTQAAKHKLL